MGERIALGSFVKEIITSLEGVVVAKAEYLTGCVHFGVQPQTLTTEGKMKDWDWIDEKRLLVVKNKKPIKLENPANPNSVSGPCKNPPSM